MRNGGKSMAEKCVRVRVPGTSANCGPGFDCLGLASPVYNDLELRLTREPGLSITMTGEGATNIPCDNRNIVWRSAQYLLEKAGKDKEYRGAVIHMENRVPLSRGLGSSATAIVAGLTAANALIGNPFIRREILQFATDIEGHPDNVAPAIFGAASLRSLRYSDASFIVSTRSSSGLSSDSFLLMISLSSVFVSSISSFNR